MSDDNRVYYNMVLGPFENDEAAAKAAHIMMGTAKACAIPVAARYPSDECGFPADADSDDSDDGYRLFHPQG